MNAPRNQIITGDALSVLRTLDTGSIDQVLTSPPYFRLRSYGDSGQLGLEASVEAWVSQLAQVAHKVHRVLVPTGSLWLNLGDSYATHAREGAGRKSLLLGPERLAMRLIADGWLLRNKIVWRKTNPMPTSVRDRLACTWEYLYVFTKQPGAFFDLDAVREPHTSGPTSTGSRAVDREDWRGPNAASRMGLAALKAAGMVGHPLGKNPGDVWQIASSNYRGVHRATFPLALADRAIRAGCPEARCSGCRMPYARTVLRTSDGGSARRGRLTPSCDCPVASKPGIVLDPFIGAGTTAIAAEKLGRDWLGIELSRDYVDEARLRIEQTRARTRAAA